jgi:hypothetical protein
MESIDKPPFKKLEAGSGIMALLRFHYQTLSNIKLLHSKNLEIKHYGSDITDI